MIKYFFRVITFSYIFCVSSFFSNAQEIKKDVLWKNYNTKNLPDTTRLNALDALVRSYIDVNPDTLFLLAKKEISLSEDTKNEKYAANGYMYIGYTYYIQDKTIKALEYFLRALAIYDKLNSKEKISKCYTFIGLIYFKQSNFPQTLNYYFKSLKIEEEANNQKGMAMSYNNIGLVYKSQFDLTKALEYYFKSLRINEQLNNKIGIANSLLNSGAVYDDQLQREKALSNYFKALKIYEDAGDEEDLSFCYICIGIIYYKQSKYDIALEYYNKAIDINQKLDNKHELCTAYLNIGALYNDMAEYKLAGINFNNAVQLSVVTGDLDQLRSSYEGLSKMYKGIGDFKNAYENHVKFKDLTDSIFNEENSKQLSDIKTNFEVGKIESELKAKAEAHEIISLEEKKRQQIVIYSVVVMLFIVLFFSFSLYRRYKLTNKQKEIIELKNKETEAQKTIIEEHQKDTIDSINYAKRIQYALLADKELLGKYFPNNFIVFHPKDIVSGDFYWAAEHDNKFYLAVGDSTGHGVPGAFMSLLNIGFLNEAVKEKNISQPNEILNFVRNRLTGTIGNDGQQDGMDVVLLTGENIRDSGNTVVISYSAANNAPLLVRNNELIELSKDKMSVGKRERIESFSMHTITLQKGDNLYLYTDGFADQFGGPKGKKFKHKQLQELLSSCSTQDIKNQKEIVTECFDEWKGKLEQVDDVCLIGIKI